MTGEQKPGGLEGEGVSATYRFAYESIRKGAPGLSDTTCMAIARSINMKVSIAAEPAEARIRNAEDHWKAWADAKVAEARRAERFQLDRATAAEAQLAKAKEALEQLYPWMPVLGQVREELKGGAAEAVSEVIEALAALQEAGEVG